MLVNIISYEYPIQIKTYLSALYDYKKYMTNYSLYLVTISENNAVIINNSNEPIPNQKILSNNFLSNLRIGSAHKPRTSDKDAKYPNFKNINVTSVVKSPFSPLKGDTYPVTTSDGLIYQNFENWWQSCKIFPDLDHIKDDKLTDKFFKWREEWCEEKEGYRIMKVNPKTKDKSVKSTSKSIRQLGYNPIGAYHDDQIYEYIDSRDYYLREYIKVIKNKQYFQSLLQRIINKENIMILDLDGPSLDKYPEGREVSWTILEEAMNNPNHPFGHGYVICALLLLLSSDKLI
jgi:hypothetical protein